MPRLKLEQFGFVGTHLPFLTKGVGIVVDIGNAVTIQVRSGSKSAQQTDTIAKVGTTTILNRHGTTVFDRLDKNLTSTTFLGEMSMP